jgi:hypothetical protein
MKMWNPNRNLDLSGWIVSRYRKDHGIWNLKGTNVLSPLEETQLIISQLSNNFKYRFTVKAVNSKGESLESEPSNPLMVEAPLRKNIKIHFF